MKHLLITFKFNNDKINIYPQLDGQKRQLCNNRIQSRLNGINRTKDYFMAEICERKAMSKALSKYKAGFDYFDKTFLVLSAKSGCISVVGYWCNGRNNKRKS